MASIEGRLSENKVNKMEAPNPIIFNDELLKTINNAKVLVVGAGGIGCELLKNLVLTGFEDIEVIDLDTIDVSNLNRQFLFQKKHVGLSKAEVARESVLLFNPSAKIVAHHANVTSQEFGVRYIEKFTLVMNALDNRAARNHVNRLCLAAGKPLIESGSSGYSGQVELIARKLTKCYECDPKPTAKTFPGCTIRNTPSQLIHCIVWAKHLFNQLFGEHDPTDEDVDVSPDPTDEEAAGSGESRGNKSISTRDWAKEEGYAADKLFTKLFEDDIKYLLSLTRLWEERTSPVPLKWSEVDGTGGESSKSAENTGIKDQILWTLSECANVFADSLSGLKRSMEKANQGYLIWDKDDKPAMDFVASAANIRAHIFHIPPKSRFDIKSMAGNIIPAIATSNAIIAGLVVLNAVNVLRGQMEQCKSAYLRYLPNPKGYIIVKEGCHEKPNPKCTVCSEQPQVTVVTDLKKMKLKEFEALVLKEKLNVVAPDVQRDSTGAVILSSEEGETEQNNDKTLNELGITDGCILLVDDFIQNYNLKLIMYHRELEREDPPFWFLTDITELKPKEETPENGKRNNELGESSKSNTNEDDDEIMLVVEDEEEKEETRKRKIEEEPTLVKKQKVEERKNSGNSSSDAIVIV